MAREHHSFQVQTGSPEQLIASSHHVELVASGDHWQVVTPAQQVRLCQLVIDTIGLLAEDTRTAAQTTALSRASDWLARHQDSGPTATECPKDSPAEQATRQQRALLASRYPSAEALELDRMQLRLSRRQIHSGEDLDLLANQAMKGKLSAEREGTRLFINMMLGIG